MRGLLNLLFAQRGVIALLAFTLVVRGGLMIARFNQLFEDPDDYHLIAHNIVRFACFSIDDPTEIGSRMGEPAPSAYRPPLYPVILSNLAIGKDQIIYYQAIAALHLGLGLATVWITWLIARALQLGWTSYLAGVLVACDPILLNQQTLIMTETLAAFCTVVAWGLLVRFHFDRNWWNAALAGAAIGLAALCRPTYLPWLGVACLIAFVLRPGVLFVPKFAGEKPKRQTNGWGLRCLNAAAMLVAGVGVMFPWGWRNYKTFQMPMLTTTHGGYTLYLANNRHFYAYLRNDRTGLPWDPKSVTKWGDQLQYSDSFYGERRSLLNKFNPRTGALDYSHEFTDDRIQTNLAREAMGEDPLGFVMAATYRVRQLWSPLPYKLTAQESKARLLLRYLTAGWYVGVYVLVVAAIFYLRAGLLRSPWLFGVLLCAIFTGAHVFYWSNLRMRAPLMPIVAVVAAAGALQWQQRRLRPAGETAGALS